MKQVWSAGFEAIADKLLDELESKGSADLVNSFGAGPHFCAGAWVSRSLVADVALPKLFARLPKLRLDGPVEVRGWAFRGPLAVPVRWD